MLNIKGMKFGVKNDNTVHISELNESERGKNCDCRCPLCGDQLIARMGKIREYHFAHKYKECDMDYATETALHRLAKEILINSKKIKIPDVIAYYDDYYTFNNLIRPKPSGKLIRKE